jgi:hypothetical protein
VHLAREEQEEAEQETKDYGPKEIAVIHNVLIYARHGV